jgi:hypothetical protein
VIAPLFSKPSRTIGLAAAVFGLAGCVGIKPIEPQAGELQAIRSIAVVSAPEPEAYEVRNLKHPGFAFGAVGGAIAAADQDDKRARLTQVLRPLKPAPTARFSQELVYQLKRLGYDARLVDAPWKQADKDKPAVDPAAVAAVAAASGGADAVLVLEPRVTGFVAAPGHDYLATLHTQVRLYGSAGGAPVLQAVYATGWAPEQHLLKATATRGREFENFDALVADPPATAQSLQCAASLLAERVSQDFQR